MPEAQSVKAWPLTCKETAERADVPWDCCESCHDDADHGWDELLTADVGGTEAYVCCHILHAVERAPEPANA